MKYWCTRRSSAGALIGVIGLVIVATLSSGCVGSGATTSEVGLVSDETISVPNSALGGSDTTLAAPTVSTLTSPASSTANLGGGGPQTPSCGIFEVTKAKVVEPPPKTAKQIATEKGEPYVAVLSMDVDPNNLHQGAF